MTEIAVMALLLVTLGLRSSERSWLAPGSFFCAYWLTAVVLPSVVAPEFRIYSTGYVLVASGVGAYALGAWSSQLGHLAGDSRSLTRAPHPGRGLVLFVVVGSIAGVLAGIAVYRAQGIGLAVLLSSSDFINATAKITAARYNGDSPVPTIAPLLLSFTYAAAVVAPMAARGMSRRLTKTAVLAAPVLAAAFYAVLTTARAGMLIGGFLLFGSWICQHIYVRGVVPSITLRGIAATAVGSACVGLLFVVIAFIRVGSNTERYQYLLGEKLQVYLVGYLPALSRYLVREESSDSARTYGQETLGGLIRWLPVQGLERSDLEPTTVGQTFRDVTTVYSVWRDLSSDFGLPGTILVMFVVGFGLSRCVNSLIATRSLGVYVVLTAGYGWILNSVVNSLFISTNVCLGLVIAYLMLRTSARFEKQASKSGQTAAAASLS